LGERVKLWEEQTPERIRAVVRCLFQVRRRRARFAEAPLAPLGHQQKPHDAFLGLDHAAFQARQGGAKRLGEAAHHVER
jgi:hypothetical protein